jgi:hypothetical protein
MRPGAKPYRQGSFVGSSFGCSVCGGSAKCNNREVAGWIKEGGNQKPISYFDYNAKAAVFQGYAVIREGLRVPKDRLIRSGKSLRKRQHSAPLTVATMGLDR